MSDPRETFLADGGRGATRELVRRRPGMYVGAAGPRGRLNLTFEVMENAIDQVVAGRASHLAVVLGVDGSIEVIDDGDGLNLQDAAVRLYFIEPHDSATADGHMPHVHLNDSGVGLFVVNALSSRMVCESSFGGLSSCAEWVQSEFVGLSEGDRAKGTSVKLWPDDVIFEPGPYPEDLLVSRLNEYAALIPELEIRFGDRTWPAESPAEGLQRLLPAGSGASDGLAYLEGSLGDDGSRASEPVLSFWSGS